MTELTLAKRKGKTWTATALCRACSKAVVDMEKHFAKPRKQ